MDELIHPLKIHLAPRLSDAVVLGVLGSAAKRIEAALRRVRCNDRVLKHTIVYPCHAFALTLSVPLCTLEHSVNLLPLGL